VALINSGDDFDEAREKSKTKNFSA
jgi:hypothetical protein